MRFCQFTKHSRYAEFSKADFMRLSSTADPLPTGAKGARFPLSAGAAKMASKG
jgi:hypothetical protein